MKLAVIIVAFGIGAAISSPCLAQGFIGGAAGGIEAGGAVAGPVGAVLGGAVGAATGTIQGILGIAEEPRRRPHSSLERGAYVRGAGAEEGVLVVDPRTGRILDIID